MANNREMTTPILPSGRPQGSGAGWGLVLAGYVVLLMLVFGHQRTPASEAAPVRPPRQPVAQPGPTPTPPPSIDEPPPLFDEPAEELAAAPPVELEPEPEIEPGTPEALGRDAIQVSVNRVKSRIRACAERNPTPGVVKLRVEVSARGRVSSVEVMQTPERKLGACVATAMKRARFDQTQRGGSFTYPFSF